MNRTLSQCTVAELENMFSKSPTDIAVLRKLEHELKFRKTQRSVTLFQKIEKALSTCGAPAEPIAAAAPPAPRTPTAKPLTKEPERTPAPKVQSPALQPDLWNAFDASQATPTPAQPRTDERQMPCKVAQPPGVTEPAPKIEPAAAFRLLGVTPTTPWEVVEQNRRRLVQDAHPSKLTRLDGPGRTAALAAARKVNAAYAVIHQLRIPVR